MSITVKTKIFSVLVVSALLAGCGGAPEPTPEPTQTIFSYEEFSRVDGSTVTLPLSVALANSTVLAADNIKHNTTHEAYLNLIAGKADIIFVTYPSDDELRLAQEANIELEITPVVNDAFVFLVNKNNPVQGLTSDQIRKIYNGQINNWSAVGGARTPIRALQRDADSGSQAGMLRFMQNEKLSAPPLDNVSTGMEGLVTEIASIDGAEDSIGYSYYFYVNSMYVRDNIKMLAVDGVAPSVTTIQSGQYPHITPYYAVFRKSEPENSFARRLTNFVLSAQGQLLAENAGYVRIPQPPRIVTQ
ncbi:MAG: substrate-binding domain-containing protein [Clostridiales bacterium]|jgi:phosphate transport system substrate-binding protein|nr:substrate-binding domain-containing protein [Clostridiales bacterium]